MLDIPLLLSLFYLRRQVSRTANTRMRWEIAVIDEWGVILVQSKADYFLKGIINEWSTRPTDIIGPTAWWVFRITYVKVWYVFKLMGFMRTFSIHQCNDHKPVRPSFKPVAVLHDYATSPITIVHFLHPQWQVTLILQCTAEFINLSFQFKSLLTTVTN